MPHDAVTPIPHNWWIDTISDWKTWYSDSSKSFPSASAATTAIWIYRTNARISVWWHPSTYPFRAKEKHQQPLRYLRMEKWKLIQFNVESVRANAAPIYLTVAAARFPLRIWNKANRHTTSPSVYPSNHYSSISLSAPISNLSAGIPSPCQRRTCLRQMYRRYVVNCNRDRWHDNNPVLANRPSANRVYHFCNRKMTQTSILTIILCNEVAKDYIWPKPLTWDHECRPRRGLLRIFSCDPTNACPYFVHTIRQLMQSERLPVVLSAIQWKGTKKKHWKRIDIWNESSRTSKQWIIYVLCGMSSWAKGETHFGTLFSAHNIRIVIIVIRRWNIYRKQFSTILVLQFTTFPRIDWTSNETIHPQEMNLTILQ